MIKNLRFISIDENGERAAKLGQEWAKWILDALRNLITVAFLFVVAEKSGKWYMWALAAIGFFALYVFVFSYINQSQFNFGQTSSFGGALLKVFLFFVALAIVIVFSIGSFVALQLMISEISALQNR